MPTLTDVVKGAWADAHVGELVRVDTLASATPWRVTEATTWRTQGAGRPERRRAEQALDLAYELVAEVGCDADQVGSTKLEHDLREFTRLLGAHYRAWVLDLIPLDPSDLRPYDASAVAERVQNTLDGWRLIGAGDVATEVKAAGRAEVVDPKGALRRTDVAALLVSTDVGPLVTELDVPCLSWERREKSRVALLVTRRFFFRAGSGTVGLTAAVATKGVAATAPPTSDTASPDLGGEPQQDGSGIGATTRR